MKKILALLLAVILVMSLSGCSGGEDSTQEKSAEEILKEAVTKSSEWESFEMEMNTIMHMGTNDGPFDMDETGVGTVFVKPLKMRTVMSAGFMGEGTEIEQYVVEENGNFTVYQQLEGLWYKQVLSELENFMAANPTENIKNFTNYLTSAEILGEEEIKGKETIKIEVTESFDMFKDFTKGNEFLDLNKMFGIDVNEVLSDIEDFTYIMWVDKESQNIVKYNMDMGEPMQKIVEGLKDVEDIPQELIDIFESFQMKITVTLYNINNAEEFELPQEALDAEEVSFTQ